VQGDLSLSSGSPAVTGPALADAFFLALRMAPRCPPIPHSLLLLQVAEMFKLDKQGKAVSVQVFYDMVC
jgi:hypothetical protein